MFPWSSVVSWLELCCPHRVTWSQQRSWDASSRSETSLPLSSLLLSVSLNAIMWLIWPWCCVSFVLFTVTLLNGKCVSVWCCRFPRVPDICAVWTHHPAGANSHTRHYEGTDYSCVLSLFFAFLCLAPVSVSFDSLFPSSLWWLYSCCQQSCLQGLGTYSGSSLLASLRSANSPSSWAVVRVELASSPERSVITSYVSVGICFTIQTEENIVGAQFDFCLLRLLP